MRLYEVWHPRTDVKKPYDNPYSFTDTSASAAAATSDSSSDSSSSSPSPSVPSSRPPVRRKGVRFACSGYCILPPHAEGWPPLLTILALSMGSILYVIMAILVKDTLPIVFTVIGGIGFLCTWYTLIAFLITDPGFLPKHITALAQLVPERLQCPPDAIGPPPPVTLLRIVPSSNPATSTDRTTTDSSSLPSPPIECKFCVTCRIWRPPHTHHCSTCGGCISDFDHHCGVLGKCVGSGNMHLFFYLLWSAMISCLYGFLYCLLILIFNSINYTYPTTDSNNNPLPNVWLYDTTQYGLWISSGVCLGILIVGNGICRCLRACMQSFCGLAFVSLLGAVGFVCLVIAYVRGAYENNQRLETYSIYQQIHSPGHRNDESVNAYQDAIIPAIIGLVPYLYVSMVVGSMAIGTTTMWSVARTTKLQLQGSNGRHPPPPMTVHTTDWSCTSRIRSLLRILCHRSMYYRAVNFRTDVAELRKLVKQAEIVIFNQAEQRIHAQQQREQEQREQEQNSNETIVHVTDTGSHTAASVTNHSIRPHCRQALEFSLPPGMMEDALMVTKIATEGLDRKPQNTKGILLGYEFLPLKGIVDHTEGST